MRLQFGGLFLISTHRILVLRPFYNNIGRNEKGSILAFSILLRADAVLTLRYFCRKVSRPLHPLQSRINTPSQLWGGQKAWLITLSALSTTLPKNT